MRKMLHVDAFDYKICTCGSIDHCLCRFRMDYVRKLVRNPNFARTNGDKIATSVFIIGGLFTFWYETCHVMPTYGLSTTTQSFNFLLAAWCYVNAMTNWYKLISTRVYPFYVELEDKKEPNWGHCQRCFSFSPTRAHHCKVCNVCVLKRDHHCWFAGTCIGYSNHRYYIVMLIYIWFAAFYCNIFNLQFLHDALGGFGLGSVFGVIFPHGAAVIGLLTFYQFCISIVTFMGLLCLVMFSWLLQIQFSQIYSGQTKHEKKHNIVDFDLGWGANIQEVLGHLRWLTLASAFLVSRLPGDGVRFSRKTKDR